MTCHLPVSIPFHWQEIVCKDLLRDETFSILEKVPHDEPSQRCHYVKITRKYDGTLRRTVDLSPLNKFHKREIFASKTPFHLACRIQGRTWKTVSNAWNGCHSVSLRKFDRHLTTFITSMGRWRYIRVTQGFLLSGDGYNRRFNAILTEFEQKECYVDDTIFYDTELENHWWRTIEFLTLVRWAVFALNPDKFQFAEQTVNFARFRISE